MATYHFRIKSDKKPDGTKISAVTHAEYVGREGKFADIDRREELWQSLAGNVITTEKMPSAFGGKYVPLYYTDDYGSIANTPKGIALTKNPSLETVAIALSLADEAMNHQPLIVSGSEKFKSKVMVAAVQSKLKITFADGFMQREFEQKLEDAKDERRRFCNQGGRFLTGRHGAKPDAEPLAGASLQTAAAAGFRLPALSERTLVSPESQNAGLFLPDDEARELVNQGKQSYSHVRWDVGRRRGRIARNMAKKILEQTEEHLDYIFAASHVEYINREKAFSQRGGCIYQGHQLPKWAKDSPKTFFAAADKYESTGNRRYREIEFSLPNELNSVEEYREIVDEFLKRHLSGHYYTYAIHDKIGAMSNGERHPHVHIMFSERQIDDVEKEAERPARTFFRYPARKKDGREQPFDERKKHGAPKARKWSEKAYLAELREDFARIQNEVLAKHGFSVRVDHRSLKAQRLEALQNGDTYLAQLLDRVPEEYIGVIAPIEEKNPRMEQLMKYREARREHQELLYAADLMRQEIEELALKDDTQKANLTAKSLMESGEYLKQAPDSELIAELRENMLAAVREVNALKNIVLTKQDIEEQAQLEYMTADERELWQKFKEASAQKKHWETFAESLRNPQEAASDIQVTYDEITAAVKEKVWALGAARELLRPQITELEKKLASPQIRPNIQKAVHQLWMDDRHNRDKLKKANERLENAAEALRQVIFAESIKDESRKILTTRQLYDILRRRYYGLKREYEKSLAVTTGLKKKVISQNQALAIAKDVFLKGAGKKLRADLRKLQKQEKWLARQETISPAQTAAIAEAKRRCLQEQERLAVLCQEPSAKAKIEEIAAGILRKNAKYAKKYDEANTRSQALAEKLHHAKEQLNAVKYRLSKENPKTMYRVVKPKTDRIAAQGTTQDSVRQEESLAKSAASVIADALLGAPEAVRLVARAGGDGLETDKTWVLMTKLDKHARKMKALLRDI